MVIFCILFFLYHNDNEVSSRNMKYQKDRPKRTYDVKKVRINRETYTTPEPCQGCPGENGQGVQLTVIYLKTRGFIFVY